MKLYFSESLKLLFKTWPFWAIKILVYFVMTLIFFLVAAVFIYIASLFSGPFGFLILIIGLLIMWGIFKLVRHYVLYLIKAGHVAVLGELVQKGSISGSEGMVGYGFKMVKSKFVTASAFFVVDRIIAAIVHGISNFIRRIGNWVPIPAVRTIFNLIAHIVSVFLNYIDEAVLSYLFTHPEKNAWKGARDGLVLYFKCWKSMLATSVILVLINYAIAIGIFFGLYVLTAPLVLLLPWAIFHEIPYFIALIIALFIKVAFLNQWTLVWMVTTYQESIKGKEPDSAAMEELERLVPKFREITSKVGKETTTTYSMQTPAQSVEIPLSPHIKQQVDKLLPYVKDQKTKGYSDAQIKAALLKANWPENVVNHAVKNP